MWCINMYKCVDKVYVILYEELIYSARWDGWLGLSDVFIYAETFPNTPHDDDLKYSGRQPNFCWMWAGWCWMVRFIKIYTVLFVHSIFLLMEHHPVKHPTNIWLPFTITPQYVNYVFINCWVDTQHLINVMNFIFKCESAC